MINGRIISKEDDNKRKASFHGVGAPILIVAFLSICLISFSILSFVTARNNYNSSKKLAELQVKYYEACNYAEEVLARIDDGIETGVMPKTVTIGDGRIIYPEYTDEGASYAIEIDDKRIFKVELVYDSTNNYKITKWQVVQ